MKDLLRRAAPEDVAAVDADSIRRRANQRRRRHRIVAGGIGVIAVLATVVAASFVRDDESDVADVDTPASLWCNLQVGDRSDVVRLDPEVGIASASVGEYRAEFSIEWQASDDATIWVDLYGPAILGSTPHPDLPDGVILRAGGGYDPASPPPGGGATMQFSSGTGSPTHERVTGGCGPERLEEPSLATNPPTSVDG